MRIGYARVCTPEQSCARSVMRWSRTAVPSTAGFRAPDQRVTSVEEVHDHYKVPSESSWFVKDLHHRLCRALLWHPIFTQDGLAGSAALCSAASITSRPQVL